MVIKKITNNDPIGLYFSNIFLDSTTKDRAIIEYQQQANRAISTYLAFPANPENCERLKGYLNHCLALANNRPQSEARDELATQLTNIIDTLQTGIDREPVRHSSSSNSKSKEPSWDQMVARAIQRWEVWGYKNRPIKTDTNTLEGFMRSLPNILEMSFEGMMRKYFWELKDLQRFFKWGADEDTEKVYKRIERELIHTFAFVKLTTVKPVYTVIENQYEDAEERYTIIEETTAKGLYNFVQEQGMEEPVEVATA